MVVSFNFLNAFLTISFELSIENPFSAVIFSFKIKVLSFKIKVLSFKLIKFCNVISNGS